jgi:hypothetical protein
MKVYVLRINGSLSVLHEDVLDMSDVVEKFRSKIGKRETSRFSAASDVSHPVIVNWEMVSMVEFFEAVQTTLHK